MRVGASKSNRSIAPTPWTERYRVKVSDALDSLPVTVFTVIITVLILFMDDLRCWLAPKSVDYGFAVVSLIIFIIFVIELIICSVVKQGYFLQFFFFLDLLVCFSLVPDIPWIWNPIIGIPSDIDLEPVSLNKLQAASHAAYYAGAANRALRFVRLLRLIRIAKLFELAVKTGQQRRKLLLQRRAGVPGSAIANRGSTSSNHVSGHYPGEGHSAVGQHLSEQTTRKVVLLVLCMLFGIPLLQPVDSNERESYTLRELNSISQNPLITQQEWANEISFIRQYYADSLLYLNVDTSASSSLNYTYVDPSLSEFRLSEMIGVDYGNCQALFSRRPEQRLHSEYDVITTIMVLVLLSVGAILFNRNNHRMVIVPIERMMATIVALQQNPLAKASIASSQPPQFNGSQQNMQTHRAQSQTDLNASTNPTSNQNPTNPVSLPTLNNNGANGANVLVNTLTNDNQMDEGNAPFQQTHRTNSNMHMSHSQSQSTLDTHNETGMLERTLEKLTGLLQVGFGEAGSKMIQKCMNLNAEGDLDPLVDGTKMLAIFGFCDIRRFTDATECLKEDVMMYVNEIAAIVHSQVSTCDGHPNKNIGDAFLLVWRLPSEMENEDIAEFQRMIAPPPKRSYINGSAQFDDEADWVAPTESSPSNARVTTTPIVRSRGQTTTDVSSVPKPKPSLLRQLTLSGHAMQNAIQSPLSLSFSPAPRQSSQSINNSPSVQSPGAYSLAQALRNIPPQRILSPALRTAVSTLADKALVSFLRIIVEIHASDELKRYALNPRIASVFTSFKVELGFGLHVGWAIEGPIGSRYKIDASYLSPHVNLAEALEGTTKVYGVPLLLSGEFHALLSPYVRALCRRLDVVKVSGRETPMSLFTFDIDPADMDEIIAGRIPTSDTPVIENPADLPHSTSVRSQFLLNPPPSAPYHFVRSCLISTLQAHIPLDFYACHARGMECYLEGEWEQASDFFNQALERRPEDTPTKVLLNYMQENNLQPPDTWQGCREL